MLNKKLNEVLNVISEFDFKTSFHLVGGTALQYHLSHRESFDIDLATTNSSLDRCEVLRLMEHIKRHSINVKDALPETAILEWEDAGFDLRDNQQEFLLDGVKFQIFTFQGTRQEKDILDNDKSERFRNISIASPSAIFKMKSLLLLKRHKSRDNFDLYHLTKNHDFTVKDILETIEKYQPHNSLQKAINNLTSSKYPLADEPLGEDVRVSLDHIKEFFQKELSKINRDKEFSFNI